MPVIYVTPTEKCVELLEFIESNMRRILGAGGKYALDGSGTIEIVKVKKSEIKKYQERGIRSTPLMVVGSRKIIGADKIKAEIVQRLRGGGGGSGRSNAAVTDDPNEYYRQEFMKGVRKDRTGKFVPEAEDEEAGEADDKDIQRRLRNYNKNPPKHRRQSSRTGADNSDEEADEDMQAARAPPRRPPARATRAPRQDNVDADFDDNEEDRPLTGNEDQIVLPQSKDPIDDDMLAAWMENNTGVA